MRRLLRFTRSRPAKIAFNTLCVAIAIVVGTLAARHFRESGWPLASASIGGVLGAGALFLLVDSAALAPMASVAAGVSTSSALFRVGLAIVAAAGVAAAAVVLALPRLSRVQRLVRFRLAGWVQEHCACAREASKAWVLVSVSWLLRGAALLVLFDALGMRASVPLALAFLCASAAAAALPVAPAGAVTQAGAGAAILVAAGVETSQAVAFAIAAQALVIVVGAVVVTLAGLWSAGRRLVPAHA
ncbi:MAG: hypothetical protein H0V84_10180 [Actinobacteria bacterium]|nr:hypothetical protein [Actinomycetota bacterium]